MKRIVPVTVRVSSNAKLQPQDRVPTGSKDRNHPVDERVVSTTIPIKQTCPPCLLKGNGCYAQTSFMKFNQWRLERIATEGGWTTDEIIDAEVAEVKRLFPDPTGLALRLHDGGGDVRTVEQARKLAALADWWLDNAGIAVWTYTHAYPRMPRVAWGRVAIQASCHYDSDIEVAVAMGYVPAVTTLVLPPDGRVFEVPDTQWSLRPCPAQTLDALTCSECRHCWDDRKLAARAVGTAFRAHGELLVQMRRRRRR